MSTEYTDISYDLIAGLFAVLDGAVTLSGVTYPVYKSIPKTPDPIYVFVGNVINDVEGTKDAFHYNGTVQVQVIDESRTRADKQLVQDILNVTRGLLKPSRATVFSISPRTLVIFNPGPFNDVVEKSDNDIVKIKLIDQYNFLIE